jgi:hypothetical protein
MIFLKIIELLISYMISCSARFQMHQWRSETKGTLSLRRALGRGELEEHDNEIQLGIA